MQPKDFTDAEVLNLSDDELRITYNAYVEALKNEAAVELMLLTDFPLQDYINREAELPPNLKKALCAALEWKRNQLRPKGVG